MYDNSEFTMGNLESNNNTIIADDGYGIYIYYDEFGFLGNNVPKVNPKKAKLIFDALSKADLFRNRVSYRQNWRLKGYMIDLMTGGVAVAKKEMYRKFTRYQYPQNIMMLGRNKRSQSRAERTSKKIIIPVALLYKKLKIHYLPYFKIILKKPYKEFMDSLNLTKDEIEACFPRLEKAIYEVDPLLIIAVGETAAKALSILHQKYLK
jgi:hypothetical protein